MRVAERGRDLAQAELARAEAALRADVGTAFFGVLAAQQRVVLAGQTLEIASSAREAAARRVAAGKVAPLERSEEHTSELQSQSNLVCRLLLEKKKHITEETRPLEPPEAPAQPALAVARLNHAHDTGRHRRHAARHFDHRQLTRRILAHRDEVN